jgi:hypothetical protein
VGQLELLEQARGLGLDLSGRQSPQAGDKLQMLSARHLHIQSSFLHGDADRTPHNLGLGEHIVPGYPRWVNRMLLTGYGIFLVSHLARSPRITGTKSTAKHSMTGMLNP